MLNLCPSNSQIGNPRGIINWLLIKNGNFALILSNNNNAQCSSFEKTVVLTSIITHVPS